VGEVLHFCEMRLKSITLFAILLGLAFSAMAQQRIEMYLSPGIGYRAMRFNADVPSSFQDSLSNMDRTKYNWSGGVRFVSDILNRRGDRFSIGLEYRGTSFMRVFEDIQFHDTVHPAVGRINDLSVSVQKDAFFNHQYRYIALPFLYNYRLLHQKNTGKFDLYLNVGVAPEILVADDIKLFLKGFTVGGESNYSIPNDYSSTSFNADFQLGFRMDYKLNETQSFILNPQIQFPILPTSEELNHSMRVFQVALNVGINLDL
jgi:hypothetical protein